MRTALLLSTLTLTLGCHARFKRQAANLDAARIEVITTSRAQVLLPRSGGLGVVSVAFDITQAVREGNIAAHIEQQVDPDQVNQAFADGLADQLGAGPPFAYHPDAPAVLQYELVNWGMQMFGFGNPGVYHYDLVVRGFGPDGRRMYRSRVRCATDASTTGWVEMSPFVGANNPNKIKNLPPGAIQAIFDATAEDCGRFAVARLRRHAGY